MGTNCVIESVSSMLEQGMGTNYVIETVNSMLEQGMGTNYVIETVNSMLLHALDFRKGYKYFFRNAKCLFMLPSQL